NPRIASLVAHWKAQEIPSGATFFQPIPKSVGSQCKKAVPASSSYLSKRIERGLTKTEVPTANQIFPELSLPLPKSSSFQN
ncbi:MAG TPA: hypothetical protein P5560_13840, partial [Thermotogota bacterium]|nr:hypothetical protein [Thermotogota bacterium]